ncbi:MAG TPA: hypothetical protein VJ505_07495 [Holophagaceae bacterium]|nr:hypothetical protein [Holophagaceae bacterium]
MSPVLWPLLNALQCGALLALTLSFGADGFARRDKVMQRLAISCALVALRHGLIAAGEVGMLHPELVLRAQSVLVSLGFVALFGAFTSLFPAHLPAQLAGWVALAFIPNYVRNLFLGPTHFLDRPFHNVANLVYVGFSLYIVSRVIQARKDGEPMAQRLLWGLIGVTIPVLVEAFLDSAFDLKVRLSGFSLLFLAAFLGASWHWGVATSLEARVEKAEVEALAWRRLAPGPTFRIGSESPLMEDLFGKEWPSQIASITLRDRHGVAYAVHGAPEQGVGWLEPLRLESAPEGFLRGWSIALGMQEGPEAQKVMGWLEAWGGQVDDWGTLPPREGPYPSILVWGREPSILSVWREDDLARRRCRWIQVGGPRTEGPHAWVDRPVDEAALEQALRGLLVV